MTTADVAQELGVTSEFVRGEILDGRLGANIIRRPGKRAVYRITPAQFQAYRVEHGPNVSRGTNTQPNQ